MLGRPSETLSVLRNPKPKLPTSMVDNCSRGVDLQTVLQPRLCHVNCSRDFAMPCQNPSLGLFCVSDLKAAARVMPDCAFWLRAIRGPMLVVRLRVRVDHCKLRTWVLAAAFGSRWGDELASPIWGRLAVRPTQDSTSRTHRNQDTAGESTGQELGRPSWSMSVIVLQQASWASGASRSMKIASCS